MTLDVLRLVESEITQQSGKCGTCRWIESRPAEEAAKWDEVLKDKARFPHAAVARAVAKADPEGLERPSKDTVARHRESGHRQ